MYITEVLSVLCWGRKMSPRSFNQCCYSVIPQVWHFMHFAPFYNHRNLSILCGGRKTSRLAFNECSINSSGIAFYAFRPIFIYIYLFIYPVYLIVWSHCMSHRLCLPKSLLSFYKKLLVLVSFHYDKFAFTRIQV